MEFIITVGTLDLILVVNIKPKNFYLWCLETTFFAFLEKHNNNFLKNLIDGYWLVSVLSN